MKIFSQRADVWISVFVWWAEVLQGGGFGESDVVCSCGGRYGECAPADIEDGVVENGGFEVEVNGLEEVADEKL
jgi:hypothetical protein